MAETVHAWGGVIVASVLAIPVAALIVMVLARRRIRTGAPRQRAWLAAAAEVGIVLGTVPWIWMILTPRPGPSQLELVPGLGLTELFDHGPARAIVQIGGNLLVFAAFGFLAPIRWPLRPYAIAACAAAGSVTVEILQYALQLGRVSSIDDVFLNTAGATLAALVSRRVATAPAATKRAGAPARR